MSAKNPVGIFTTDRNLIIRSWNAFLEEITGLPASTVKGKHISEIIPDLDKRGLLQKFERVAAGGAVEVLASAFHHYLIPLPPRTRESRFTLMQQTVRLAPLRENVQSVGVLVTIDDVTERLEKEALIRTLREEDWQVRKETVSLLSRQSNPDVVVELLHALQKEHNNPSVLNSALQVLAMSDWDTVAPLMSFLKDKDYDLRTYAALALGESGDARAVPRLVEALQDADVNVRYHAIESLGKLKAVDAIPDLVAVAQSAQFFLAFTAIDALAAIGHSGVVPKLLPLLEDDLLRIPAAKALGKLGDEHVTAPIAALLSTPGTAVESVATALVELHERFERQYGEGAYIADLARPHLGPKASKALVGALDRISDNELRAVITVLGWSDDETAAVALARSLGSPIARDEVIAGLVRFGKRVTSNLVQRLSDPDAGTRQAAGVALGRIGDRQATPALIESLSDPDLTTIAAGALAAMGDPDAYRPLLALIGNENPAVRQAAVAALNSLGHPDLPSHALELLRDINPRVRESAAQIAGYFGFRECQDLLLERCQDSDENVRRAAIESLPYVDHPDAIRRLKETLNGETPLLRAAAARALAHMDTTVACPLLIQATEDGDSWVRYHAIRSLAAHRLSELVDVFGWFARHDNATHVRIAAVDALGGIGGETAEKVLIELRKSFNRDVAEAAGKFV